MSKTLVLGLDACSWPILKKAIDAGRIPTLAEHVENGVAARLESTVPASTTPAWKAMTTGKNPGRLGVFTTRLGAWGGAERAALQSDFRSADYWDYLNEYRGLQTAILNLPNTYPTRELDGVMVAGRGIPEVGTYHVYPEGAKQRLESAGYPPYRKFLSDLKRSPDATLDEALEYVDGQFAGAMDLLDDHDIVHLTTLVTDQFEHEYLDGEPVMELYGRIDDRLADLEASFPDLNLVVVSDHGMTEKPDETIFVNAWLAQEGYLVTADSEPTSSDDSDGWVWSFWERLPPGVKNVVRAVLNRTNTRETMSNRYGKDTYYNVDWEASTAVRHVGGIYVKDSDLEVIERLIREFDEEFGHLYPDSLDPFLPATEVYEGPHIDQAPDLMEHPELIQHVRTRRIKSGQTVSTDFDEKWNYVHHPTGVFVVDGPRFESSDDRLDASIYDVMPTLLSAYGMSVNGSFDGCTRTTMLAASESETVEELPPPEDGDRPADIDEYTDSIQDQLRDLGYLE